MGSFGLGIVAFYLNFLYRGLGFAEAQIGALAAAQAVGALASAYPSSRFAAAHTRRASLLVGGTVVGAGVCGILLLDSLPALVLSSALLGGGGLLVASSGAALLADASSDLYRFRLFGQQVAIGTSAAFVASTLAGALAVPIAALLGVPPGDVRTMRFRVGLGSLVALASGLPVLLLRRAPIARRRQEGQVRASVIKRFLAVELAWGFGAGSFMPFQNLFFADRFGLPFAGLGVVLGALAVAGSLGALTHGRLLVPAIGFRGAFGATVLASIPFVLIGAAAAALPVVAGVFAARTALVYGAAASYRAYTLASFTSAERVGAFVTLAIAYNAALATASLLSGTIRSALGDVGWSVNLVLLCAFYALAAVLVHRLFVRHAPTGDLAGAEAGPARDSSV